MEYVVIRHLVDALINFPNEADKDEYSIRETRDVYDYT